MVVAQLQKWHVTVVKMIENYWRPPELLHYNLVSIYTYTHKTVVLHCSYWKGTDVYTNLDVANSSTIEMMSCCLGHFTVCRRERCGWCVEQKNLTWSKSVLEHQVQRLCEPFLPSYSLNICCIPSHLENLPKTFRKDTKNGNLKGSWNMIVWDYPPEN